jgi:sulfotransferase
VATQPQIHFISGLPRSGSTLLAGLLLQNPRFRASMSGPLGEIYRNALVIMSTAESALFLSDKDRERILHGIVASYYSGLPDGTVVFDAHRGWTGLMPSVARIFSNSRVICCLRNPAWIMDSIERLVQSNCFRVPKMFPPEASGLGARVEHMKTNFVGGPLNGLRQAWFGENAKRIIAIRYNSLVSQPGHVMQRLYEELELPLYNHDFENVEYDEPEFDERLNMPGLHRVRRRVEARERQTILPPDLFRQNDLEFWEMPGYNPQGVCIL